MVKYCLELSHFNPEIIPLSQLSKMMEDTFKEMGENMHYSAIKNLRRRIERDVNSVKFININRSLYLYPTNINLEYLIAELVKIQTELKVMKEKYESCTIEEEKLLLSAKTVQKEIREMDDTIPWPPEPSDLGPEKFCMPRTLELFLTTLLQNRKGLLVEKSEIVKNSIAQDIVYAVTNGRVKTPKSILLPTMVKSLTNNTEIIDVLNKLGHGISYTSLMESQTENAYKIVEHQTNTNMILPVDCLKETFTIYVADNIDRNEETISGIMVYV